MENRISESEYANFCVRLARREFVGLRVGQAFINVHFRSGMVDPDLFYETDPHKAHALILEQYVRAD